jgi:hypothetical protein
MGNQLHNIKCKARTVLEAPSLDTCSVKRPLSFERSTEKLQLASPIIRAIFRGFIGSNPPKVWKKFFNM